MVLWAGMDEAGYGPLLGPLVITCTALRTNHVPAEGELWTTLDDAVSKSSSRADGRVVINDSKKVYSTSRGIRALEEGVLSFHAQRSEIPRSMDQFLAETLHSDVNPTDGTPWCDGIRQIDLPLRSNRSAIASRSHSLAKVLHQRDIVFQNLCSTVVLPSEYNSIVGRTTKSQLLWQKCGLLLQDIWRKCGDSSCYVLIDRHGGRKHYRKQLTDVFPRMDIKILKEENNASLYLLKKADRKLWVAFKQKGDQLALPTALASMTAKYTREIYMHAFNNYWTGRVQDLSPTAGYAADAKRFISEIDGVIRRDGIRRSDLIRGI